MAEFRLSGEAESELDWLHIVQNSGSIAIANRVIDSITETSGCSHNIPTSDGDAMTICVLGYVHSL
jgi:hypothetical protein